MCCGQTLKYTSVYKYLGVLFHENLQEKPTVEALTNAAIRSFGRITGIFKKLKNLGIRSYETLYESYIIPILNYGAGVWGFSEQAQPQVLQNRMKRYFMGVNKFAPNSALSLEFGWLDMKFRRWLEMIRYWNRLCEMSNDRWPKIVTKWDMSLKASGWTDQVSQILGYAGMNTNLESFHNVDLDDLEKNLHRINEGIWLLEAHSKPKLRTFVKLYDRECPREIVEANLSRNYRSALVKLKIGVLPLQIETDRWKDTPLEYRLCRICNDALLEDEMHFLLQCEALVTERTALFQELIDRADYEIEGDESNLMQKMYRKGAIKITGKHVTEMIERRRSLLYDNMALKEELDEDDL